MSVRPAILTLAFLCVMPVLIGCEVKLTRPDQDNLVLDTSRVPLERFLAASSTRFGGSWEVTEITLPSQDPNKDYVLKTTDVMVGLSAMPHDRCNPNASLHTTFDPAYRVDFVYRTADPAKREGAKKKLFRAASDVGTRLTKFEECPPLEDKPLKPISGAEG